MIKKILLRGFSILISSILMIFLYCHLIQHRSMRSWLREKQLWIMRVKYPEDKQNDTDFKAYLDMIQKQEEALVSVPDFLNNVDEEDFNGMQVFSWNDKHDPNQKVLFFIHGGGYISNPAECHYKSMDYLSKKLDAKVVFPIYKKAPKFNYLDSLDNLKALYERALSQTSSCSNITLIGDSAGGGLALGLAYRIKDYNIPQPKDIILISPWLDLNMDNSDIIEYEDKDPSLNSWQLRKLGELWAGCKEDMKNPYVSPIYGDVHGLNNITMFIGTRDIFYPDIIKFDNILKQADISHKTIVCENQNHDYVLMPANIIPEAEKGIKIIIDTINNVH